MIQARQIKIRSAHLEALGMRGEAAVPTLEAADEDVGLALPALGRRHQLPELE